MSAGDPPAFDPISDSLIATRLCAIDPGLGGMVVRGGYDHRDMMVAELHKALPAGAPLRRIPSHIDDERLLGGIDLTATLALGKPVTRIGLLAEADGGMVVVPMAERLSDATAGRIAAVMDTGELVVERDGTAMRAPARFVLVACDDGLGQDERPAAALAERLAFWIDLSQVDWHAERAAVDTMPDIVAADEAMETLAATAAALGIDSARASHFALRAARALARLSGRSAMTGGDLAFAARMVLAPRATRIPAPPAEPAPEDEANASPPPPENDGSDEETGEPGEIEDMVLAAALAALPRDVLARIAEGAAKRGRVTNQRGAGERRKSGQRGRPKGTVAGVPGGGRRLSLIDTLRAAAPWQKLRNATGRVAIRRDDLRVRRFETRAEVLTIFAVDASGSAAVARLAEAKARSNCCWPKPMSNAPMSRWLRFAAPRPNSCCRPRGR